MTQEHVLKLKAVLDTTEVKAQLDKLNLQTASSKGGNSLNYAVNINKSIASLNSSIHRLLMSIDRLAATSKMQLVAPSRANGGVPLAIDPSKLLSGGNVKIPSIIASSLYKNLKSILDDILFKDLTKQERDVLNARYGDDSAKWSRMLLQGKFGQDMRNQYLQAQGSIIHKQYPYRWSLIGADAAVPSAASTGIKPYANLMKSGAAFVGGTLMNNAADLIEINNEGQRTTGSRALRIAGGALKGMALGAAGGSIIPGVGTGVGAAVGAAAGALTAALNDLKQSATETATAMQQLKNEMFKGQSIDKQVNTFFLNRADEKAVKDKDTKYVEDEIKKAQELRDKATKTLNESGLGFEGKGKWDVREYARQTAELAKSKGADSREVIERRNALKLYEGNFNVVKEQTDRIKKLEDMRKQIKEADTTNLSNVESKAKKDTALSEKGVRAWLQYDSWLAPLEERLKTLEAPGMENVNSLASQGLMISETDDDARMQMQLDYIREIANVTREIKNIEKQKEGAVYI